ncbi:MAG TPA: hypothetical protein VKQ08_04775 [Cyclobacteriaceae bacterium]|nr:hypothetical protein [Cyclobacteriaceae bacterium]
MKARQSAESILLALLELLCLCYCVPLKEVVTFTSNSNNALLAVNFSYGYFNYSRDSTYIILKDPGDTVLVRELRNVDCTKCSSAAKLDTLIKKEFTIVAGYYGGLAKLSGSGLINFSPIGKAVSAGTYVGVTISKDEASYFGDLTTVVSDLFTAGYRSKEIKKIVKEHEMAVQEAFDLLILHIDNMQSKIDLVKKEYKTRLENWIDLSKTYREKWLLIDRYKQKSKEFDEAVLYYKNLKKTVQKIKDGDKVLYNSINKLNDESFRKQIMGFAADIIYLNSSTKN